MALEGDLPFTSHRNPRLRWVRRLRTEARLRREEGLWVAEGPRLAAEVLRTGLTRRLWIFSEGWERAGEAEFRLHRAATKRGEESVVVSDATFGGLSDTVSPQGIMVVFEAPGLSLEEVLASPGPLLALDGIQDPGNLGTMARSAEAAGAGALLLGEATADPGNPKALRASAGSLLRVPALSVDNLGTAVGAAGRRVYATTGRSGVAYDEVDLTHPFVLLVGQEGRGLSPELAAQAELQLSIPMEGRVESLNASAAAAVILFEAARQRRAAARGA